MREHSTAIYEGLSFGLQTILLALPGVEYMDHLIEERAARIVTSPAELVERTRKESASQIQTERFFKPASLNNMQQTTDELLKV